MLDHSPRPKSSPLTHGQTLWQGKTDTMMENVAQDVQHKEFHFEPDEAADTRPLVEHTLVLSHGHSYAIGSHFPGRPHQEIIQFMCWPRRLERQITWSKTQSCKRQDCE